MSKFERVLSDDELWAAASEVEWQGTIGQYRLIEQAVLAKLAEQNAPIAWLHEETSDVISSELKDYAPEMLKGYDTPLYKSPCSSCKGKLDSSTGGATPDGWQLVPIEPTYNMTENAHNCDSYFDVRDIYKAMLAAAPKYTGESK